MTYFHPERMPVLPARRREAARHQLEQVVVRTANARRRPPVVIAAAIVILVLSTGAAAGAMAFHAITDQTTARCFTVPDRHAGNHFFTTITSASEPGTSAYVRDALHTCRGLFLAGQLIAGHRLVIAHWQRVSSAPALVACPRCQHAERTVLFESLNADLEEIASSDASCLRLQQIPGVGPLVSTAVVSAIGNGAAFKKGREFAAWLGLVPRQWSIGGKAKLLGISKRGNPYLRKMFIHGARAAVLRVKRKESTLGRWMSGLETRTARNVVIVATANKLARISWAVLASGENYHPTHKALAFSN